MSDIRKTVATTILSLSGLVGSAIPVSAQEKSPQTTGGVTNREEKNNSGLKPEISIDEKIVRISSGLLRWNALSESEKSDSKFMIAALSSKENRDAAMWDLSPAYISQKEIQDAIIQVLGEKSGGRTTIPHDILMLLVASDEFKSKILTLPPSDKVTQNAINNIFSGNYLYRRTKNIDAKKTLDNTSRNEENLSQLRKSITSRYIQLFAQAIENKQNPSELNKIVRTIPSLVVVTKEFGDLNTQLLKVADDFDLCVTCAIRSSNQELIISKLGRFLSSSNPDERDTSAEAILLRTTTPSILEKSDIANFYSKALKNVLQNPNNNESYADTLMSIPKELRASPNFIKIVIAIADTGQSLKIPEVLYKDAPEVKSKLVEELTRRDSLVAIWKKLAETHNVLILVHPLALEIPDIRERFRKTCNQMIYQDRSLHVSSDKLQQYMALGLVVPELFRVPLEAPLFAKFTESRRLARILRKDEFSDLSAAVISNPNCLPQIFKREHPLPEEALHAFKRVQSTFGELGIQGWNRFDNAKEIIHQRFRVADTKRQDTLRNLMPDGYFDNLLPDNRPVCLFVCASPESDEFEVFGRMNSGFLKTDYIDRLTQHYRVILLEVRRGSDIGREILDLKEKHGVSADLCFVAGHGSQGGIALGVDEDERLSATDTIIFGSIKQVLKPGSTLGLISCETASSQSDEKSIHTACVETFPDCFVIGPDKSTQSPHLHLSADGKFESLQYVGANGVIYDPTTKTTSIQKGLTAEENEQAENSERKPYEAEIVKSAFYLGLGIPVSLAGAWLVFSNLGAFVRRVRKSWNVASTERKQPSLFPGYWDRSQFRRFSRAFIRNK